MRTPANEARKKVRGGIPVLEGYPVVGILPRFRREPFGTLLSATREVGDVVRLPFPGKDWVLLSRPDHVEHVLKGNRDNYVKGYDGARALLGDGLPLNEGESWLRQRRLMQPAFHRRRIARFAGAMVEEAEGTLRGWEGHASSGTPLDMGKEMTLLTQRIIVKTMFGSDVGARGEKISRAFDVAMRGIEFRSQLPLWASRLPLPVNRRFGRAFATLDEEVRRIIGERRRERSGGDGEGPDDLLGLLLEARDEETGEGMDERQVRDEVMNVYLAGHESTAVLLTWVWHLLSEHPEAARRVRDEALDVAGDRPPGLEDLPKLAHARMVIDETLRLYPSAWVLARRAVEDDEIGGYPVPAGTGLFVCPYVTHRRADLWPNPEGFDPERFAPDGDGSPRYAYYPFGGGPRQCIGQNFALMEATLIVASVARRYRLDLVPGQGIEPLPRGTMRPSSEVWMVPRDVGAVDRPRAAR